MAVYKVLQDIEAEDKFLGPLTLRQFIYGAIASVSAYISFLTLSKGVWVVAAMLSPIILFTGFLAWPWSKDQPTEIWLLAKIRFFIKPRRRIWDQTGMKDLVNITAPKREDRQVTDGLSQGEVKSRLQALANTLDSRGWVVKNVGVSLLSQPAYGLNQSESDRLIDPATLPQAIPSSDATALDDVMDERSSPTAQHLSQMLNASAQSHRQQAVDDMQHATTAAPSDKAATQGQPADYWFVHEDPSLSTPGAATFSGSPIFTPGTVPTTSTSIPPTVEEAAVLDKIHRQASLPDPSNYHQRTVQPPSAKTTASNRPKATKKGQESTQSTSSSPPDPAILELANNDDLNVATIARQVNQTRKQPPQDEVVIPLR
ncbi:PrgI family protein [Candidatus Saccharibacteria bacterium]|nr:PrgI family protein [Candidatus Saccharibacteria bacterium]